MRALIATLVLGATVPASADELVDALRKKFPGAEIQEPYAPSQPDAVAAPTASDAPAVGFEYESFHKTQTGAVEIVLKFTNNTDENLRAVFADCALLDKDHKAVTVIRVAAENIEPGGVAYGNNFGPRIDGIEHAECRVSRYR